MSKDAQAQHEDMPLLDFLVLLAAIVFLTVLVISTEVRLCRLEDCVALERMSPLQGVKVKAHEFMEAWR